MSEQKSQEGSGQEKNFSYAELCERARKHAAEQQQKEEEKKGKGLEFMAYRMDVARKYFELSVQKKVTPAEQNLLFYLTMGTVGAQNMRSQICTKAEFFISDISAELGYKEKDKIWKLLKSLHKKGYITREKTRTKDREFLGLDPNAFGGQILIDKHDQIDKKRHLKLAVDNTKPPVEKPADEPTGSPTNRRCTTDEPKVEDRQSVGDEPTDRRCSSLEVNEITGENAALDSSRSYLDSLRGQNREPETYVSQWDREREQEKIQAEKERQLSAARKAGII